MKPLLTAIGFLTVLSVGRWEAQSLDSDAFSRSMAWFPVVGLLQGFFIAGAAFAMSFALPMTVVAAIVIALLAFTNGGLHLDGFIDTVDGLAGGATPGERLRVMKDTAAGAVGVAAVAILLLTKYAAIVSLPADCLYIYLILFPVVGRFAIIPLGAWAPYARSEGGLGAVFDGAGRVALPWATVFTVLLVAVLSGAAGLFAVAVVIMGTVVSAVFFIRRLGGVTGDVYGFHSEISEVLFLISAIAGYNIF